MIPVPMHFVGVEERIQEVPLKGDRLRMPCDIVSTLPAGEDDLQIFLDLGCPSTDDVGMQRSEDKDRAIVKPCELRL